MLTLPPFSHRAGSVCALISNTRFSQAVKSTFPNVNNTLDNIHTYLASIPQARMVLLPYVGGKGPGRTSSPKSPLRKDSRGAGSREGSPPSLTPFLCSYSKSILSSTRAMSRWTMPTAASRVRVCDGSGWSTPMALWPGGGFLGSGGVVRVYFSALFLWGCLKGLGLEALPSSSSAPVSAFLYSGSSLGRVMQVVGKWGYPHCPPPGGG